MIDRTVLQYSWIGFRGDAMQARATRARANKNALATRKKETVSRFNCGLFRRLDALRGADGSERAPVARLAGREKRRSRNGPKSAHAAGRRGGWRTSAHHTRVSARTRARARPSPPPRPPPPHARPPAAMAAPRVMADTGAEVGAGYGAERKKRVVVRGAGRRQGALGRCRGGAAGGWWGREEGGVGRAAAVAGRANSVRGVRQRDDDRAVARSARR